MANEDEDDDDDGDIMYADCSTPPFPLPLPSLSHSLQRQRKGIVCVFERTSYSFSGKREDDGAIFPSGPYAPPPPFLFRLTPNLRPFGKLEFVTHFHYPPLSGFSNVPSARDVCPFGGARQRGGQSSREKWRDTMYGWGGVK